MQLLFTSFLRRTSSSCAICICWTSPRFQTRHHQSEGSWNRGTPSHGQTNCHLPYQLWDFSSAAASYLPLLFEKWDWLASPEDHCLIIEILHALKWIFLSLHGQSWSVCGFWIRDILLLAVQKLKWACPLPWTDNIEPSVPPLKSKTFVYRVYDTCSAWDKV